ncbi:rhodanese-like domain-containing protein [Streptomyces sp. NPDC049597]|uniref:sulfurtransferase n=1 Tax=Streptomyces sp. NPDC049597 TaxID=3155276 RepID=UPI00344AE138
MLQASGRATAGCTTRWAAVRRCSALTWCISGGAGPARSGRIAAPRHRPRAALPCDPEPQPRPAASGRRPRPRQRTSQLTLAGLLGCWKDCPVLISVPELRRKLGQSGLVVIDARAPVGEPARGHAKYREGHIPGARWLSWDEALHARDPHTPGRLPEAERIRGALAACGVGEGDSIVAYDDNQQFTAAQLVWILHTYGFRRVHRLDGGWPCWTALGGAVEHGEPAVEPRTGPALPAHASESSRAEIDHVRALINEGAPILDCRRDSSWCEDPYLIPTAQRLPVRLLLDDNGLFLPPSRRLRIAQEAGALADRTTLVYCGASISAAAVWLGLTEAGWEDVRLYDGGLPEWTSLGHPVQANTRPS